MAIDRKKIIDDLSKIEIRGNEEGLIPAFNVLVNQLPTEFWNKFGVKILNIVSPELQEAAWGLLYNAANTCGYHTGYGIITSEEWKAVVAPMVERIPEDILYGAYAVFTAWGWANAEIVDLVPGRRMVVRAYDYYESDVNMERKSPIPMAPMITGVSSAFMDLAYGEPYPNGHRTFICKQTKGIECGDDFGEFVVTKVDEFADFMFLS
ncbi:hypothetical protein JXJ21_04985 [candidate division KSB1 bacterium]|nr:hypothetical protein [candidate division KSB1 bacterium]